MTQPVRVLLDELLSRGDDDIELVSLPGRKGAKVGLRLLSDAEQADADRAAREWAEKAGLDVSLRRHGEVEWAMAYAAEILMRALVHPETRQPLVASTEQLRQRLNRGQIEGLIASYNEMARRLLASPAELSDDELREIVEELRRDPFGADRLTRYGRDTLCSLLRCMASRLAASTGSASSSTTSE